MADLVSVLMSMRDAELYVREALDSILIESQVPLEVIVVENGSSDDSAEVVSSIGDERIHLVQGPCRTIAEALNAGLEQVRGDIVMRCDADDRYVPGRIARQVEWLESHSDFGAVCGSFVTVDRRGKLISTLDHRQVDEEITDELRSGTTRTHVNTFAIHTELLRDLDGFQCHTCLVPGEVGIRIPPP
jgi:glycosyltransferase involved in cell wall biosynthesis